MLPNFDAGTQNIYEVRLRLVKNPAYILLVAENGNLDGAKAPGLWR